MDTRPVYPSGSARSADSTMASNFRHEPSALPDPSARPVLGAVLSAVAQAPAIAVRYIQDKLITNPRLSNPDLLEEDAKLFSLYGEAVSAGKDASDIRDAIKSRFLELYSSAADSYTGRENLEWLQRHFSAFQYAAEALGVFDYDQFEQIKREIFRGYLTDDDKRLLCRYSSDPSDENKALIMDRIKQYSADQLSAVWGTPEKKRFVFGMNAFIHMTLCEGVPENEVLSSSILDFSEALRKYPKEISLITSAQDASFTPEKYDDHFSIFGLAGIYEPALQELYCLLEQDPIDLKAVSDLSSILSSAREYYEACGGDPAQLDAIEVRTRGNEPFNGSVERQGGISVYLPEQLPEDIKTELSRVLVDGQTALDLVRDKVQRVIVTDEMPSEDVTHLFVGSGAAGSYLGNGVVFLRRIDDPREMASTLFHEATHAKWERDYSIPLEVRKQIALNEGNAFLNGYFADKQIGMDTGQYLMARSVACTIGSFDFREAVDAAKIMDLSVYPTKTLPYVTDALSIPLIPPEVLTLDADETASAEVFVRANESCCALSDEGGLLYNPAWMNEVQISELASALPGRESDLVDGINRQREVKDAADRVLITLIQLVQDKSLLSDEVAAAVAEIDDPMIKGAIEGLYEQGTPYADIGRMLFIITLPQLNIGIERFKSVLQEILPPDEPGLKTDITVRMSTLRSLVAENFGLEPQELTDYGLLRCISVMLEAAQSQ